MRLTARRALPLLLPLAAMLAAAPATAQDRTFQAGVWDGKVAFDERGGFRHCMVARSFPNGATLFLAIDGRDLLSLALHDQGLGLETDKEYHAVMSIDERWSARVTGVALGPTLLIFPLPNDPTMRGHIQQGSVLSFHGRGGETMDFPLEDTVKALPAVVECAQRNRE